VEKKEKHAEVSSQKRQGKCVAKKYFFAQESPIDGPSEEKSSPEIECSAQILSSLPLNKKRRCDRKLEIPTLAKGTEY
jgi:hypothetical protein